MRILYLETPYSLFFYFLNRQLRPKAFHAHIFNLGYWLYFPTMNFSLVGNKIKSYKADENTINLIKKIPSLVNSNIRSPKSYELDEMARYYLYLKDFIRDHGITHCFCYNDLRWQHAIAKHVCLELGVKTLFFEEGYFRPNTITIDQSGINAYAIEAVKGYLANENIMSNHSPLKPTFIQKWATNFYFLFFMALYMLGKWTGLNTKTQNKFYSFGKYFVLYLRQRRNEFLTRSRAGGTTTEQQPMKKSNQKIIYVPLQVSADSQTVIHSRFKDTQTVISLIEKVFYGLPNEILNSYRLVFRKHPMALNDIYQFDSRSEVSLDSPASLIEECEFMITVNSTVTVDALTAEKRVILLGKSIFELNKLCSYAATDQDLARLIQKNVAGPQITVSEKEANRDFLRRLKFGYQVNCNFYNFRSNLPRVAERVVSV